MKIIFRFELINSIIEYINMKINKIVEIDPIEEMLFQKIIKSEKIIYRRGIPFNPKKCCGKKVKLVDVIILIKLIIIQLLLKLKFVRSGNQKIILDKMEKITPIEST